MDCKEILLLAFLGLVELTPGMSIATKDIQPFPGNLTVVDKTDKYIQPFPEKFTVVNRTVTCVNSSVEVVFGYTVLSCKDIRVDGMKIFHGNNDYKIFGADPVAEHNSNLCPDCPCGAYTKEPNDAFALCSAMLASHGVQKQVVQAVMPDPICTQKGNREPRIKFYLVSPAKEKKVPKWKAVHVANGYISKLQCMLNKKG